MIFKLLKYLYRAGKTYFVEGSLHGLRFIAEKDRHWTERLVWLVLCSLSWVGSGLLIAASWEAFQNNAVSFVVETTYLHVNTSFPSVSVCEEDNMARVYEASHLLFGAEHDCNLDEVLKEITYFRGTAYYLKEFCFSGDIDCPKGNFSQLAESVRSPCEGTFTECSWRGVNFDCCQHFAPTKTEIGICYTFSMRHERARMRKGLPYLSLMSNRRVPLGSLQFGLNVSTKVYLHSEADVPFYNTMTTDILIAESNAAKSYGISIIDIENGADLSQLTVHQRKCRFPHENYLQSSDIYSYSACVVDCRRKEQLKICNCTSHLMPKSKLEEQCDMSGLLCLNNHYGSLSVQKTRWSRKEGLICDCLPDCNDPEYSVITVSSQPIPENISTMEIFLDRLPSERYKRNVVRGRLDLVVSMGGAAGLFVGASLLSFVEILYFFIFRSASGEAEKDTAGEEKKSKDSRQHKEMEKEVGKRKSVNNYAKQIEVLSRARKTIMMSQQRKIHDIPKRTTFSQMYLP